MIGQINTKGAKVDNEKLISTIMFVGVGAITFFTFYKIYSMVKNVKEEYKNKELETKK
jgi:hypothetical protein